MLFTMLLNLFLKVLLSLFQVHFAKEHIYISTAYDFMVFLLDATHIVDRYLRY